MNRFYMGFRDYATDTDRLWSGLEYALRCYKKMQLIIILYNLFIYNEHKIMTKLLMDNA